MARLIVKQGERVTEHELSEEAVVIGRDPECELFFSDKKLSRRHARVEPSGTGFALVDLSSRNGSWVNEERVTERLLADGDELRLGGLTLLFESETPELVLSEDEGDESTIYLSRVAEGEAGGTVALSGEAAESLRSAPPPSLAPSSLPADEGTIALPREDGPQEESATRALSAAEMAALADEEADEEAEADETLRRPEGEGPDQTVVLAGEARPAGNTGTVLFRSEVRPIAPSGPKEAHGASEISHTTLARSVDESERGDAVEPRDASAARGGGHALRLAALAAAAALFAVLVLAVPLMHAFGGALSEESTLRARALVALLAVANEAPLGQGRMDEVTIRRVSEEAGVTGALVLDSRGRVLAPRERAGETPSFPALDVPLADVRKLQSGRGENGDLVIAEPVSYRGRRVGVALVTLRTPSAGWPALVLLLGSALLLMGLTTAVFLTRRLTLGPVRDFLEDVEAVSGAPEQQVSTERPFVELSALAESVNRILGRPKSST